MLSMMDKSILRNELQVGMTEPKCNSSNFAFLYKEGQAGLLGTELHLWSCLK